MWLSIVTFWRTKAWPWIKAHPWQTAFFPVTLLAFLLGVRSWRDKPAPVPVPIPPKTDQVASEQRHEQAVEELHQKAEALLVKASAEQVAEYEKLKAKGLEATPAEVAKWIDQF